MASFGLAKPNGTVTVAFCPYEFVELESTGKTCSAHFPSLLDTSRTGKGVRKNRFGLRDVRVVGRDRVG